jgi:hypothetical protein
MCLRSGSRIESVTHLPPSPFFHYHFPQTLPFRFTLTSFPRRYMCKLAFFQNPLTSRIDQFHVSPIFWDTHGGCGCRPRTNKEQIYRIPRQHRQQRRWRQRRRKWARSLGFETQQSNAAAAEGGRGGSGSVTAAALERSAAALAAVALAAAAVAVAAQWKRQRGDGGSGGSGSGSTAALAVAAARREVELGRMSCRDFNCRQLVVKDDGC